MANDHDSHTHTPSFIRLRAKYYYIGGQAFKTSRADSCTSGIVVCLENSKWDEYFTIKSSILLNF